MDCRIVGCQKQLEIEQLKTENEQLKMIIAGTADPLLSSSLRENIRAELINVMNEEINQLKTQLEKKNEP